MIRKEVNDYNILEFLNKYQTVLTVGDYINRDYIFFNDINIIDNKIILNIKNDNKLFNLMNKYERFTLSFLNKKDINKELVLIYDNDSFVSYIKEARFVFKLKKEKEEKNSDFILITSTITSFLGQEDED